MIDKLGLAAWICAIVIDSAIHIPELIFALRSWNTDCFLLARWGVITSAIAFVLILWYAPIMIVKSNVTLKLRIITFLIHFGYSVVWTSYGVILVFGDNCMHSHARPLWMLSTVIIIISCATIWAPLTGIYNTLDTLKKEKIIYINP